MKSSLIYPAAATLSILFTGYPIAAGAQAVDCRAEQRLFIQESVADGSLGFCGTTGDRPKAQLSGVWDDNSGERRKTANVALAFRLGSPVTVRGAERSIFAFAEATGSESNTATLSNELRLGVVAASLYAPGRAEGEGNRRLFIGTVASAFHLTDFDGDASGFGFSYAVRPQFNGNNFKINTRLNDPFWMTLGFGLDALFVHEGGNTGYSDRSEEIWANTNAGLNYATPVRLGNEPIELSAELSLDHDFSASDTRILRTMELSIPLSDKVSLNVRNLRGDDRSSTDVDRTELALSFLF